MLPPSADFYDTAAAYQHAFEVDWRRVTDKEKVKRLIKMNMKGSKRPLAQVKAALQTHYPMLCRVFTFYAATGNYGGSAFAMQNNTYNEWLDDCNIVELGSRYVSQGELDLIFVATNLEEDKKSAESKVNLDR